VGEEGLQPRQDCRQQTGGGHLVRRQVRLDNVPCPGVLGAFGGGGKSTEEKVGFHKEKKTKSLKRKEADPSPEPSSPSTFEDFSDEETDDSSEDSSDDRVSKPKKGKAGGKKEKKAAPPKKKPKTEDEKKAEKSKKADKKRAVGLLKKVEVSLKSLRDTVRHDRILEVSESVLDPVKASLQELALLQKALGRVVDGNLDHEAVVSATTFDWKVVAKQKSKLAKALDKL